MVRTQPVSIREAIPVWVRVALHSFGGPAGQIAVMHRVLVEEKRWIPESRFLHALNFCMLLPGPEAQQLATYIGWLLNSTIGGLVAGCLFVLPGFLSILGLSLLYALFQGAAPLQAIFFGIKPAVLAIVVEALIRIGRRALRSGVMAAIAGMAFFAIFFLELPFPLIILSAALLGFVGSRLRPRGSLTPRAPRQEDHGDVATEVDSVIAPGGGEPVRPTIGRALRILAICLALWFGPLAVIALCDGRDNIYIREGLLFSKAAVLTFGGAYAVLAYVAQEVVNVHGWLSPREMLDGLGMAETTPGPLIQVVQFVGFMGAYRSPGNLPPLVAATLGAILTTWVTYVPCFLWIFLGAPYVEILRRKRALAAALSSITAAVVGVILNLSIWFALHTLFATVDEVRTHGLRLLVPAWRSLDPVGPHRSRRDGSHASVPDRHDPHAFRLRRPRTRLPSSPVSLRDTLPWAASCGLPTEFRSGEDRGRMRAPRRGKHLSRPRGARRLDVLQEVRYRFVAIISQLTGRRSRGCPAPRSHSRTGCVGRACV